MHAILFDRRVTTMLQIGFLLNGSVGSWPQAHPELRVVGVDSWEDDYLDAFDQYIRDPVMIPLLGGVGHRGKFLATLRKQGFYRSAIAAIANFNDRFIPVRGRSPDVLPGLKGAGLSPGLVDIDADLWPSRQKTSPLAATVEKRLVDLPVLQLDVLNAVRAGSFLEISGRTRRAAFHDI